MKNGSFETYTMRLVDANSEAAIHARALIANSFRTRLSAYPSLNHKHYLIIETKSDGHPVIAACSSVSFASEQNLFSEKYLLNPIQKEIDERLNVQSSRSIICEIGGLSTNPAIIPSVRTVVAYFPWFAARFGCEYALVTVTSYMRIALAHAGAPFEPFCTADADKLPAQERSRWGKYYDFEPQTGIIDLKCLSFLSRTATDTEQLTEIEIRLPSFRRAEACS